MKTLRWWDYVTLNIYWLGLNIASESTEKVPLRRLDRYDTHYL